MVSTWSNGSILPWPASPGRSCVRCATLEIFGANSLCAEALIKLLQAGTSWLGWATTATEVWPAVLAPLRISQRSLGQGLEAPPLPCPGAPDLDSLAPPSGCWRPSWLRWPATSPEALAELTEVVACLVRSSGSPSARTPRFDPES